MTFSTSCRLSVPLRACVLVGALFSSSAAWAAGFGTAASMSTARSQHTAVLLPNGKVLVVAGFGSSGVLGSAVLYDPAANAWSAAASLATARANCTAVLLTNGKVLVAGGYNGLVSLSSAVLYDPAANTWSAAASLPAARRDYTVTLLPNGKVLLAGGFATSESNQSKTAVLYDPASNSWSAAASMAQGRSQHTATLLPNGKVLVVGGIMDPSGAGLRGAELYDPAANTWSAAASLATGRASHAAALLSNGKVLAAGGETFIQSSGSYVYFRSAELYDPAANAWSSAGNMAAAREFYTATPLSNGKALLAGGFNGASFLSSGELYDPAANAWGAAGNMAAARYLHTATLLQNGKVLLAGGANSSGKLSSAELYTPDTVVSNPPTVATAASAAPNPVTGTTTALSVLGADDGGEANLTYTWSWTGPAGVTFSANGTNAAKNSTATFGAAGSYSFRATLTDGGGLTATSNVTVIVNQTLTSIAVAPASVSVPVNGTQPFTATAKDQFGNAMAPQPAFAWAVSGGGAINASGLFTAAAAAGGPFTVTASSGGKSGTASVTVTIVTDLMGYWKLEEASGVRADSSGLGNALTDNGGVGSAAGKVGAAASFSGSNYLSISNAAQSGLNVGSALTAAAWVNLTAAQAPSDFGMVLSKYDLGANGRSYRLDLEGGKLAAALSPDGASASTAFLSGVTTLAAGQWYHVAVVFDGSAKTAQLYLNGKPEGSARSTAFGSLFATSAPLALGADYNNGAPVQLLPGRIDEARVYNRALAGSEIAALAQGPRTLKRDFDGDGKEDILLRHSSSGEAVLWLLK